MSKTTIEWASDSRNYYEWLCHKVSPGCANCYMMSQARRYGKEPVGIPRWRAKIWTEKIKPGHVYFVNSMSDTYHEGVPIRWVHAIHNDALAHPEATFLLLTKRIERAYYLSPNLAWPPNLWLGTSIENADYLWRLDYLLEIPAAGHFVSAEPLLGSLAQRTSPGNRYRGIEEYLYIDMKSPQFTSTRGARLRKHRLGWVIVGAESGGNRRPFNKDWAREIRDMCIAAGTPFLYKQGSAFKSGQDRFLDGRQWNETPFYLEKHSGETWTPPAVVEPLQMSLF